MKILIYVPVVILDGEGGVATHVRELAENLLKLGNEVTIVCRLRNRTYRSSASIKRIKTPNVKVIGIIFSTISGLLFGTWTLARENYDLIYTRAGLSASAWFISRLAKVPYVTEVNGLIWDEAKISWVGWWRKTFGYFLNWIEGKAYRRSQRVVAVTPRIKEVLVAEYGMETDKIAVIPNAANTVLFKPMDTKQARKQLNLPELCYLIVFVGHLAAWQGVEYLIRSAPYILKGYPESKFLIVGDGTMKQGLIELTQRIQVSDRMIFTGRVPYDKVPLYINASDVCVAPFIKERNERSGVSPLKIYEYGACGKAIVTSRLPGLEFVEQYETGVLIQPDNAEELANAIVKLFKDEGLRRQMGENGRKYVVKNHSWDSLARRVAEVCQQALENYTRQPEVKFGPDQ